MPKGSPIDGIPITDFYGEETTWPVADILHCEELHLRSAMYDWQIKPHRHDHLVQLFYVKDGSGLAEVDSLKYSLCAGDLLIVPQQCVHTFRWEQGSKGYVLYIAKPLLTKLEGVLGDLPWAHQLGQQLSTGNDEELVLTLLSTLCDEYSAKRSQREIFTENLALSLFIWINRQFAHKALTEIVSKDKAQAHLNHYTKLIEEHFNTQHKVEWYAEKIGITAAHLNSICKDKLQQSALSVIHQRQLAEAKRNLIYTAKSSAEIADELGFSDPAYFSRFFKRLTGNSPGAFRKS